MRQKCETKAGRAHGEPKIWEIQSLGDSGDWKFRKIRSFGRLEDLGIFSGDPVDWEIREAGGMGRLGEIIVCG